MEVGPPSEVEEIFDAISYSKGASIIRMLHHWIGDEVLFVYSLRAVNSAVHSSALWFSVTIQDFRKGMNSYLTKFKLSNARTGTAAHLT